MAGSAKCFVSAFADATGVAVINLILVEHRMADTHHSMERHSLRKRSGTNSTPFGIPHGKELVIPKTE